MKCTCHNTLCCCYLYIFQFSFFSYKQIIIYPFSPKLPPVNYRGQTSTGYTPELIVGAKE